MKGKTDPISIRINEAHLQAAKAKSGIKKTQQLIDFLFSEYANDTKPKSQAPIKIVTTKESTPIGGKPKNLDELKALCPSELTGLERSNWISSERQKYNI